MGFSSKERCYILSAIDNHGEWVVVNSIYFASLWRMISELRASDTDIVWLATAIHVINFMATKDPSPIHYNIVRELLEKYEVRDNRAVDLLVRELVNGCREVQAYILKAFQDKNHSFAALPFQNEGFYLPSRDYLPGFICANEGMNSLDALFCEFLESRGGVGEKVSKMVRNQAKKRFQEFQERGHDNQTRQILWATCWIDKKMANPVYAKYLTILSDVIWQEKIKEKFGRLKSHFPAIPKVLFSQTLKPVLKKNKIENVQDRIVAISEEQTVVAAVKVSLMDEKLLYLIKRGLSSFGSLTGHRLLRWEIKSGCQNIINGNPNPSSIVIEGGYEGIARAIGCGKNKAQVTDVKAILNAQARCCFNYPNGDKTSGLIILKEIGFHRNKEPNKIQITLGSELLPDYLFTLPKSASKLLLPFVDFPPLIGSPNTHAAQALLQLLILEEFSQQSDRLAEKGAVFIPKSKWELLSNEAALPRNSLDNVIIGWSSNSNGNVFLEKNGDEYTLSMIHVDALEFLLEQGRRRIRGSIAGKKSAEKSANRKKRVLEGKVKGT